MEHQRRRQLFSLVLVVLLVGLFVAGGWAIVRSGGLKNRLGTTTSIAPGYYRVDHFVDGDTIAVDMNGNTETVRMIGIDTPETHKPGTPVQCFGPQAAEYTETLIGRSSVRLQADPLNTNRDRYNRLLRYVYLPDGRMVEEELLKNGYAFAYTQFPFQKLEEFSQAETTAETAKVGLWSACQVEIQDNGRKQTAPA